MNRNEDAERDCDRVLALDPRNIKALFRRGQARVGLQKLVDARDGASPPSHAHVRPNIRSQRYDADFRHAMQLDPGNSAAKAELGKVEVALKVQSAPRPVRAAAHGPEADRLTRAA